MRGNLSFPEIRGKKNYIFSWVGILKGISRVAVRGSSLKINGRKIFKKARSKETERCSWTPQAIRHCLDLRMRCTARNKCYYILRMERDGLLKGLLAQQSNLTRKSVREPKEDEMKEMKMEDLRYPQRDQRINTVKPLALSPRELPYVPNWRFLIIPLGALFTGLATATIS